MAISFDETDDYYTITDAAELTLPDGDWCIGVWVYVSDNTGTSFQYLISNNNYLVANSFNLYLHEASESTAPNTWRCTMKSSTGISRILIGTATPGADNTWRLIVVQRVTADNELQLWLCERDSTAVKDASISNNTFSTVNGGDWNIGRRTDGDADRYYGSLAAEIFKGDFSLSQTEIENLAAGHTILSLGKSPDLYLPMWQADATLTDLSGNGNDATRQDTPTTSTHPPVITPAKRRRQEAI